MEHILTAFVSIATPYTIVIMIIGTVMGIIIGALPGLGTILALSIALPFTFAMEPISAIALLLAVYASSIYGGSISAVLLNAPGTPQSAATCLDGFPMAQQGKAGEALGWVTAASALGGLLSVAILVVAAPQLAKVSRAFGPIEIFALLVFALTCISWVSDGSFAKGILAALFGLFLGVIGVDPMSGDPRFQFDIFQLSAGISLIPVLVGLFALSEALMIVGGGGLGDSGNRYGRIRIKLPSWSSWKPRLRTLITSSAIGSFFGILPGPGAVMGSFVAYSEAKRTSPRQDNFGKGEPEGLVAAESSNNAVTGGALVPTLALGIPGDAATAIMLTALMIHGVIPGPRMFELNAELVYGIFAALMVVNILMFVLGLAMSNLLVRILNIPQTLLAPMIVLFSVAGTYSLRSSFFDLILLLIFGVVGYLMRRAKFPVAPVVIGLVLGPRLELALRQGLLLTDGDFFAFFSHPIAAGFLTITTLVVATTVCRGIKSGSGSENTTPD